MNCGSVKIAIGGLVALILAGSPFFGIPAWTPALATVTFATALSLIGLNLIFGVAGMLALGQAAFLVLPGYFAGMFQNAGLSGWAAIPIGLMVSVLLARVVSEIFVRLPGIYLAIGTLGFAYVVEGLARAFPGMTGGASGLVLSPPVSMGPIGWYLTSLLVLVFGIMSFKLTVRGRYWRTLRLVRHDELAAEVVGINVVKTKVAIFTIGSIYTGAGGLLLAYYVRVLSPEMGGVNASLEQLAMVIIGGAGSTMGPLLGSLAVHWLFMIAGTADRYELVVYGGAFLVVLLFAPAGINGLLQRLWAYCFGVIFGKKRPETVGGPARQEPIHVIRTPQRINKSGPCLQIVDATKTFGGLVAVDAVNLAVNFGQIVALIGPNGAGKSTLFNLVNGLERPTSGEIRLEGLRINDMPVHARARVIGRSFQVPRLVPELTALENVATGSDHLPGMQGESHKLAAGREMLKQFGLSEFAEANVAAIGIGHHKLIELARAAVGHPSLLILDEPAVGLTADEVCRLSELLIMLRNAGAAILVVEHNVEFVSKVADEIVVMDGGRRIARGSAAEIMADSKVQAAYFGALE